MENGAEFWGWKQNYAIHSNGIIRPIKYDDFHSNWIPHQLDIWIWEQRPADQIISCQYRVTTQNYFDSICKGGVTQWVPRSEYRGKKKTHCRGRCNWNGSHEIKPTGYEINHHQVEARQANQTDTSVGTSGSNGRSNLCPDPRTKKQENEFGFHVSRVSRRICSERSNRKMSMNIKQRYGIHLRIIHSWSQFYQTYSTEDQEKGGIIEGIHGNLRILREQGIQTQAPEWIMKHKNMLRISLQANKRSNNTHLLTCIEEIQQNDPSKRTSRVRNQHLRHLPQHFQLHTDAGFYPK